MLIHNTALYHLCIKLQKPIAGTVRGTVHLTSFSPLTAIQSLSMFFLFLKVVKALSWSFSVDILANGNWECKKYVCSTLPITALKVYPTMTTSDPEKPGNVKKVYCHKMWNVLSHSSIIYSWIHKYIHVQFIHIRDTLCSKSWFHDSLVYITGRFPYIIAQLHVYKHSVLMIMKIY